MMGLYSKYTGIYQIRNLINGKRYVGSAAGAKGFQGRWSNHKSCFQRGVHHNRYLQRAWNKYGEQQFVFEVLIICEPEQCLKLEQRLLDTGQFEYNLFPTVSSSRGFRHDEKTKKKISASHIGKKFSIATKQRMSRSKRYGRVGSAKLQPNDIRKIRKLLIDGVFQRIIADQFGVSRYAITDIKRGRSWSYIR